MGMRLAHQWCTHATTGPTLPSDNTREQVLLFVRLSSLSDRHRQISGSKHLALLHRLVCLLCEVLVDADLLVVTTVVEACDHIGEWFRWILWRAVVRLDDVARVGAVVLHHLAWLRGRRVGIERGW